MGSRRKIFSDKVVRLARDPPLSSERRPREHRAGLPYSGVPGLSALHQPSTSERGAVL